MRPLEALLDVVARCRLDRLLRGLLLECLDVGLAERLQVQFTCGKVGPEHVVGGVGVSGSAETGLGVAQAVVGLPHHLLNVGY